jgi:hypothetical protein
VVRLAAAWLLVSAVLLAGCGERGGIVTIQDGSSVKTLSDLKVGDCVAGSGLNGGLNNMGSMLVYHCPRDYTPYQLVAISPKEQGCPDGKVDGSVYASFEQTDAESLTNPYPKTTLYCFALNVIPGKCYTQDNKNYLDKTDYATPSIGAPTITAVSQVDGNPNADCAPDQQRCAFPVPVRVVCLTAPRPTN